MDEGDSASSEEERSREPKDSVREVGGVAGRRYVCELIWERTRDVRVEVVRVKVTNIPAAEAEERYTDGTSYGGGKGVKRTLVSLIG